MEKHEVIKMLFEKHLEQLSQKRTKMHNTLEKTILILLIIAGWNISTDTELTWQMFWTITPVVILICIGASISLISANKSYWVIKKVVNKLNIIIGLYEEGKYIENTSLYPKAWSRFSWLNYLIAVVPHTLLVYAFGALCILSVYFKIK